jgi:hypothetical protein
MNTNRSTAQRKCAACGTEISTNVAGHSLIAPDGTKFPVCSDICSSKICDSLRQQKMSRETDRVLRELGIV